jgi:hypothetical protein
MTQEQTTTARPLAVHLFDCLMLDCWPRAAAVADWGINSADHLGALEAAVRSGASASDLDAVCGDGERIMELVKKWAPDSVYASATFRTVYDMMRGDEGDEGEEHEPH